MFNNKADILSEVDKYMYLVFQGVKSIHRKIEKAISLTKKTKTTYLKVCYMNNYVIIR